MGAICAVLGNRVEVYFRVVGKLFLLVRFSQGYSDVYASTKNSNPKMRWRKLRPNPMSALDISAQ
jgi:hypothetical protein